MEFVCLLWTLYQLFWEISKLIVDCESWGTWGLLAPHKELKAHLPFRGPCPFQRLTNGVTLSHRDVRARFSKQTVPRSQGHLVSVAISSDPVLLLVSGWWYRGGCAYQVYRANSNSLPQKHWHFRTRDSAHWAEPQADVVQLVVVPLRLSPFFPSPHPRLHSGLLVSHPH